MINKFLASCPAYDEPVESSLPKAGFRNRSPTAEEPAGFLAGTDFREEVACAHRAIGRIENTKEAARYSREAEKQK